jgi:hypothetical protein
MKRPTTGVASTLSELPRAELKEVYLGKEKTLEPSRKACVNARTGELFEIVSDQYKMIQHADAFANVLDAAGISEDKAVFRYYKGTAEMYVDTGAKITDDALGISLGVKVWNSYDKSRGMGVQVKRTMNYTGIREKAIVLYGVRQICSNGMKIRVPLSALNASELDNMKPEEVVAQEEFIQITEKQMATLQNDTGYVRHKGNIDLKFESLLRTIRASTNYIQTKINRAMDATMTQPEFVKFLADTMHLSERDMDKLIADYFKEKQTKWAAYNVITAHTTHKVHNMMRQDQQLDRAWALIGGD